MTDLYKRIGDAMGRYLPPDEVARYCSDEARKGLSEKMEVLVDAALPRPEETTRIEPRTKRKFSANPQME
jgi:hypothetical protein